MNLHKNISLTLVGVVAVFAVGSYFALSKTLIPAFDSLEIASADEDVRRAQSGLDSYARQLSYASTDWGQWDETYAFVQGQNQEFESENLELDSIVALGLNLMAIYDLSGTQRWSMFVETGSDISEQVDESILDDETLTLLRQFDTSTDVKLRLAQSRSGPIMIAAQPVVRSDKSGPVVGTLIMGRLLDDTRIADLRQITKVALNITVPSEVESTLPKAGSHDFLGAIEHMAEENSRTARQLLYDAHGDAIAVLSVESPRSITNLRRDTITTLFALFAGLGVLIVIGLSFALDRLVVQPITGLRQKMTEIKEVGDLSERVDMQRSDEIGDLSEAFDSMLHELDDARKHHIDQSFKAGMAEVAAGTLHNVRNALMPILNQVVIARDTALSSKDDNTRRAIDELLFNDLSIDRRDKLLEFLQLARAKADENCCGVVGNLQQATDQLDNVVAILKDQEKYTHADPVLEKTNVAELIREALSVIPENDDLHVEVQIDDLASRCNVRAHRIGLLQVLNNILLNGYESISATKEKRGVISVMTKVESEAETPRVHISICDSGSGIGPEVIDHIFDRGFTCKEHSTGGLGLHWSANAIAGMGGQISAFSAGEGQGAEIRVTLNAA